MSENESRARQTYERKVEASSNRIAKRLGGTFVKNERWTYVVPREANVLVQNDG